MATKPITTLIVITVLIILIAGCIDNTAAPEATPTPEIVYVVATSTPTPEPTAIPTPKYTKIYCQMITTMTIYDEYDNYVDYYSDTAETTIPYTDYDWTDDSATIEDILDAAQMQYTYIDIISEDLSYPADNKCVFNYEYDVYFDGGSMIMTIYGSGTRY